MSALGQGDEAAVPGPTPGRGNGLRAESYVAIADLDPHLADAMLDALREHGVAAYAVPITNRQHGDFTLPRYRPLLDRLHVDSAATDDARALLDQRLPEIMADFRRAERASAPEAEQLSDDEIWAGIVAAYDAPAAADPVPRWPTSEDVPGPGNGEPDDGPGPDDAPEPPADKPAATSAGGAAPAEDHFVPPPPPPLPAADTVTRFAWAGMIGGPLFFLLTALLRIQVASWLAVLAVAAFVGGFVTLVARMKDRDPGDGASPDDGAVV
jgi:hypothetical protein